VKVHEKAREARRTKARFVLRLKLREEEEVESAIRFFVLSLEGVQKGSRLTFCMARTLEGGKEKGTKGEEKVSVASRRLPRLQVPPTTPPPFYSLSRLDVVLKFAALLLNLIEGDVVGDNEGDLKLLDSVTDGDELEGEGKVEETSGLKLRRL